MLPELKTLAKDWRWLVDLDHQSLLAISPFGDLLLRDDTGEISLLDINLGVLEYAPTNGTDPASLFPIAFDDRIARDYRAAGLFLQPGKCYGLKIACVTGGSFEIDNIYIASVAEYVSFLGDFHYQIKDIPDGTKVKLKVVNLGKPS
jgi:Domain of unknown function (DUF1851)